MHGCSRSLPTSELCHHHCWTVMVGVCEYGFTLEKLAAAFLFGSMFWHNNGLSVSCLQAEWLYSGQAEWLATYICTSRAYLLSISPTFLSLHRRWQLGQPEALASHICRKAFHSHIYLGLGLYYSKAGEMRSEGREMQKRMPTLRWWN